MARRISAVGCVTVSLRRSMGRLFSCCVTLIPHHSEKQVLAQDDGIAPSVDPAILPNQGSSKRTPKKQNVAVSVLEFESTQAIAGILERYEKLDIARPELRRQRVRIGDMDVGVPA